MEKCMTGRFGFHPGGADVRVEYVRARERIVLTCVIFCGTASSRSALVLERLWVRDSSNSTKDLTHDSNDLLLLLLLLLLWLLSLLLLLLAVILIFVESLRSVVSVVLLHSISILDSC